MTKKAKKKTDKKKHAPKTPKCSKKESEERVLQCLEWLELGHTRGRIVQEGYKMWGIGDRQVDKYYALAREQVQKVYDKQKGNLASDIIQKLDAIFDRAFYEGEERFTKEGDPYQVFDLTNARQAIMDKAKICGAIRDQIDLNDIKAPDLSNIPRDKIIAKLRKDRSKK